MKNKYTTFIPIPPIYQEGEGQKYSIKLACTSQALSFWFNIFSWILILGGTINIFLLSELNTKNNEIAIAIPNGSNLIFIFIHSLIIKIGLELKKRAKDASRLSSAANRAMKLSQAQQNKAGESGDLQAYKVSIEAKSTWLEGRMNQQYLDSIIQKTKEQT